MLSFYFYNNLFVKTSSIDLVRLNRNIFDDITAILSEIQETAYLKITEIDLPAFAEFSRQYSTVTSGDSYGIT